MSPTSHVLFLQNRYGTLALDRVKDWVLEYPDAKRRPPVIFKGGDIHSADELERRILSSFVSSLPTHGTRQNAGFGPVPSRQVYGWWIDAYNRLYPRMNERQKRRLTAMYLLMAYVHADEDYMPMKTMLSGHPNFLSDVKSVPVLMAFLFPEHPMAAEWADEFEKFLELNTRYHTRPPVPAWQASGGRWTENLGTYVWAFLRPAVRAAFLLHAHGDGKNRLVTPQMAQIGDWIVQAQSAPFAGEDPEHYRGPDGKLPTHYWGMVTGENGPRRLHPPQGAHSARRMAPKTVWLLGDLLRQYRPLLAEHLMWSARPTDDDAEHRNDEPDAWSILYDGREDNRGTNPHLRSSKYTGYGVVLRAGVDTPGELSLHLQQIDSGPNYRWGIAGEGGNGVLYLYAGGTSYSHNGREDVGDRHVHDTDFCTNFGVWKNGSFRSVGRNVLDRPMYDLGVAQFAEIVPRQGSTAYSWPEYQGRSVLLAGGDYVVTYDAVFNGAVAHRFSWFTHAGDDLPFIHLVKGGKRERQTLKTEVTTGETRGVRYDGKRDSLAVVSHKPGVTAEATDYGCRVALGGGVDHVVRSQKPTDHSADGSRFRGTAGLIRRRADGSREMALFHGSLIGTGGVTLAAPPGDLAIGARWKDPAELQGTYQAAKATSLWLAWEDGLPQAVTFYIDGAKRQVRREGNHLDVELPAGTHRWQVSASLPVPPPPHMLRTENLSGGAKIFFTPVAGATRYRVELSRDGGAAWESLATTTEPTCALSGVENGVKVHVRAIAVNDLHESAPADEYPVYVTDKAPPPPDGLKLHVGDKKVDLTWGEVLGITEYRVYRRVKGRKPFALVYRGRAPSHTDRDIGVIPAFPEPGAVAAADPARKSHAIYEYAVSAVTGNGEGARCVPVDTDPASWRNWDPKPGEGFRRRYSGRDFADEDDTPLRYP